MTTAYIDKKRWWSNAYPPPPLLAYTNTNWLVTYSFEYSFSNERQLFTCYLLQQMCVPTKGSIQSTGMECTLTIVIHSTTTLMRALVTVNTHVWSGTIVNTSIMTTPPLRVDYTTQLRMSISLNNQKQKRWSLDIYVEVSAIWISLEVTVNTFGICWVIKFECILDLILHITTLYRIITLVCFFG